MTLFQSFKKKKNKVFILDYFLQIPEMITLTEEDFP